MDLQFLQLERFGKLIRTTLLILLKKDGQNQLSLLLKRQLLNQLEKKKASEKVWLYEKEI
jgi:hypothetical protein